MVTPLELPLFKDNFIGITCFHMVQRLFSYYNIRRKESKHRFFPQKGKGKMWKKWKMWIVMLIKNYLQPKNVEKP